MFATSTSAIDPQYVRNIIVVRDTAAGKREMVITYPKPELVHL
jgi:hypothetical protein